MANKVSKDTAYGFLTRGCPRGCDFCIVGKKEGRCSVKVADLSEFWNGQKNIVLLDPNMFACRDWKDLSDAPVNIICANPRKRKLYKLENVIWVTDQGQPLILIDIGKESDMDAEMISACEEDEKSADDLEGQMQIEDFPEVMP